MNVLNRHRFTTRHPCSPSSASWPSLVGARQTKLDRRSRTSIPNHIHVYKHTYICIHTYYVYIYIYVILVAGLKAHRSGTIQSPEVMKHSSHQRRRSLRQTPSGRVSLTVELPTKTNFGKMNAANWQNSNCIGQKGRPHAGV